VPAIKGVMYILTGLPALIKLDNEGFSIWIKFHKLVQNDMSQSTVVMWSKSKPDVEFQYGGRSGEFNVVKVPFTNRPTITKCMTLSGMCLHLTISLWRVVIHWNNFRHDMACTSSPAVTRVLTDTVTSSSLIGTHIAVCPSISFVSCIKTRTYPQSFSPSGSHAGCWTFRYFASLPPGRFATTCELWP